MKFRELAAGVAIAALLLTGCGDDNGSETDTSAEPAVIELTAKDKAEIKSIAAKLETAGVAKNGKQVCALLQPALIDEAFGSKARCAVQIKRSLGPAAMKNLKVASIEATSTGAAVSFTRAPDQPLDVVKIDGEWYFDLSGAIDPAAVPAEP